MTFCQLVLLENYIAADVTSTMVTPVSDCIHPASMLLNMQLFFSVVECSIWVALTGIFTFQNNL